MDKKQINEDIIDTEYEEEKPPIYLSVSECAKIIDERETALRYWCDYFNDILHIKRNGRNRCIDEKSLKILKDIHILRRKEKYTMPQTYDYVKKKYNDNIKVLQKIPKNNNELFIKAIANEISIDLNKSLDSISNNIIENISNNIQNQNKLQLQNKNELERYIKDTIKDCVTDIKSSLDDKEVNADKKDLELTKLLKKILEERREEYKKTKKQSLFTRIFHKNRS